MENFILYPALLFPAIPLMMTNFTHRYNSCAALVRKIHAEIIEKKIDTKDVMGRRYIAQIKTLTYRIKLIKLIQTLSGIALFSNLLTIFFGYIQKPDSAAIASSISPSIAAGTAIWAGTVSTRAGSMSSAPAKPFTEPVVCLWALTAARSMPRSS